MINNSDERLGRNGIEEIKKHPFFLLGKEIYDKIYNVNPQLFDNCW